MYIYTYRRIVRPLTSMVNVYLHIQKNSQTTYVYGECIFTHTYRRIVRPLTSMVNVYLHIQKNSQTTYVYGECIFTYLWLLTYGGFLVQDP